MPDHSPETSPLPAGLAARRVPQFPTRHYPYRRPDAGTRAAAELPPDFQPTPGRAYRFFLGRDPAPVLLTTAEVTELLHDPFARIFLQRERGPVTLRELLAGLDAENASPDGLPRQRVFLVADGGQIPWTLQTAALPRLLRFAIARQRGGGDADLLVSTAAPFDSAEVFMQVLAWDNVSRAFQFYDRTRGAWFWAGSSWQALEPDTRGQGPFDSHVNGGLVMKELKVPWQNWHSMAAAISPDVLPPGDPLRNDPLFLAVESADQLELIVRGGLNRWTQSRFDRCIAGGRLTRAREFMRQVIETTSVNLVTSRDVSRAIVAEDELHLPFTFFLNNTAFRDVLGLTPVFKSPNAPAQLYLDCLARYDVAIGAEGFRFPGDTHFAFAVPEPATEDLVIVQGLVTRGLLPRKLAAALLMVDFPNPVFSRRRAQLLAYVPEEFGPDDVAARFVGAVEPSTAALTEGTPEHEFLALWRVPDAAWEATYTARLQAYLNAVAARLVTADGFDAYFRLAESRRREFRKIPLAEFLLTTPRTNVPEEAPLLEMAEDATVRPKA